MQEKGKFPSQTQPNPRRVHELSSSSEPPPRMDEVKAVITLRSGKEVEQPLPKPVEKGTEEKEAELEKIVIKEDAVKKSTPPPPFPQALKSKKKTINVTPRFPVRPDWRIRTGFRDVRPNTGTLYLIFFLKKKNRTCICGYGPHSIIESKYYIHITESHLLIQNCTFTFTNQSAEPTVMNPLQVCWPSCMRMFADVFSYTYTD